ncbi:MAG: acyl-CoA dehydrogenase family protein, partial [Actinomycetota bacterium]|nr:acyl-CoA dehydrogenase family protein [Actinomycetota bacterium]
RAAANRRMGSPGPEGSIGKMAGAEHNKRVYEFCMDLLGPQGLLYDDYASGGEGSGLVSISRVAFLRSRANTIEGGTAEIMRNILGERVLGLPGDVRVDRDRPWKDVPRS